MLFKKILIFCSIAALATSINIAYALTDAEKAFYKEHPENFVKRMFLDEPTNKLSAPKQIFFKFLAFLIPALGYAIIFEELHHINFKLHHPELTFITASIIGGVCFWYYKSYCKTCIYEETLLSFLKQYQPALQTIGKDTQQFLALGDDNLRFYLPQNLLATFDTLANRISTLGPDGFNNDEINNLFNAIQIEINKTYPDYQDKTPIFYSSILVALMVKFIS